MSDSFVSDHCMHGVPAIISKVVQRKPPYCYVDWSAL